jgi:hypothetical protein
MRKKIGFLALALVIGVAFLAGLFITPTMVKAYAKQSNSQLFSQEIQAKVFTDFYNTFPDELNKGFVEIGTIKVLHDFAENIYYDVELLPIGYLIYNSTFETAMEINAEGISPYSDLNGDLIYGGATYYFTRSFLRDGNEQYSHTVLNKQFSVNAEQKLLLIEASNKKKNAVDEEIATKRMFTRNSTTDDTINAWGEWSGDESVSISQPSVIRDCSADYYDGTTWQPYNYMGNCGYVASAYLVHYQRVAKDWSSFDTISFQLCEYIRNGRPGPSGYQSIQDALTDYSQPRGHGNAVNQWHGIGVFASAIYDRVAENRPVLLAATGLPGTNEGHAVVVTEVKRHYYRAIWTGGVTTYSNFYFYCHYGWQPQRNAQGVVISHTNNVAVNYNSNDMDLQVEIFFGN